VKAELFSRDVLEFLRVLAEQEVRYLLIGGAAVIYHGYARLTGDVDFLYDCSPENADRLWRALQIFWGGSVPAVAGPHELVDPKLVVQFGRPPNRIDLIAGLDAVPFADAWKNRVHETVVMGSRSVPVWILGLEDLKRAKKSAGRPKDLDDLDHLRGR
jgi:predicted nucleotidyltransferase